jgi:hypothetical protein
MGQLTGRRWLTLQRWAYASIEKLVSSSSHALALHEQNTQKAHRSGKMEVDGIEQIPD